MDVRSHAERIAHRIVRSAVEDDAVEFLAELLDKVAKRRGAADGSSGGVSPVAEAVGQAGLAAASPDGKAASTAKPTKDGIG
jgi:hypothetical protein